MADTILILGDALHYAGIPLIIASAILLHQAAKLRIDGGNWQLQYLAGGSYRGRGSRYQRLGAACLSVGMILALSGGVLSQAAYLVLRSEGLPYDPYVYGLQPFSIWAIAGMLLFLLPAGSIVTLLRERERHDPLVKPERWIPPKEELTPRGLRYHSALLPLTMLAVGCIVIGVVAQIVP